ncbi:hypothetical protein ACPOL_1514 [Acidisarcina polymorpha]|uniref:Uncharacterized protein n=1 Tax=Acidisarcina polymorpha TaxID=2211140 RepID=A0A2Z5FVU3_9BACT|nr:hypothetical protein ACPOL_1514 [Acidisarcina polymorpha]
MAENYGHGGHSRCLDYLSRASRVAIGGPTRRSVDGGSA